MRAEVQWHKDVRPPESVGPLQEHLVADVIIVGAGVTGCSAALHAAELGANVVLLDACELGAGGAGKNAGLVNPGSWLRPSQVDALLGEQKGRQFNTLLGNSAAAVFDLIARHQIDCDALNAGNLHCAISQKGLKEIHIRCDEAMALGVPVTLLGADDAMERTGASGLLGALFDRRAGEVVPFYSLLKKTLQKIFQYYCLRQKMHINLHL